MIRRLRQLTLVCLAAAGACDLGDGRWSWPSSDSGKSGSGSGFRRLFGGSDTRRNEPWTIECNAFEGPNHRGMADRLAGALKRVRNLRPDAVRVDHTEDRSVVYYGSYSLEYVQKGGESVVKFSSRINQDLRFVRSLSVDNRFPFFTARRLPMPIEDVGPPEWDLRFAKGAFSLQVGVTYATPSLHNYKQAAVEWVRALREDGYQAFYYHNPDKPQSDVCVGTFGKDAMKKERDGTTRYSDEVIHLQSKSVFCWNLENGHKFGRRVGPNRALFYNQSFLVLIPSPQNLEWWNRYKSVPR